eukprot:8458908-Heterocapsa_arctica.AAC.1
MVLIRSPMRDELLPIKHAAIQIELELVSSAEEAVVTSDDATNSKLWYISDAQERVCPFNSVLGITRFNRLQAETTISL